MPKPKSRPQQWREALEIAQDLLAEVDSKMDELKAVVQGDLRHVQEEYEEWMDNLPENLLESTLGEKLEEVCSIDFENADDLDEIRNSLEEAEGVELPLGFGRD
jgi:hypothetical protein